MTDPSFLNSPRRILSLSKERATVSFTDPDDKVSGFPVSEEHGTKPSEVYGFVGSISTIMTTVIYLIWAYTPEPWLRSVGITYYPSRYWALALPSYAMVTIVLAITFYIGLNFMVILFLRFRRKEMSNLLNLYQIAGSIKLTVSCLILQIDVELLDFSWI